MAILEGGYRLPSRKLTGPETQRLGRPRQPNGLIPPGTRQQVAAFSRHPAYSGSSRSSDSLEPTPAPATNYDALFRGSIDRQRADIDTQLRSAMSAVAAREAQAGGLLARQPGEVNAVYDAAEPSINQAAADSAKTQAALNITPLAGDQAGLEPIKAALATARAGRLSDLPYLQAGSSDLFNRQRGALDTAAIEARSGLDSQMQDFYMQNAMADRQEAAQRDSLFQELATREHFDRRAEKRQAGAAQAEQQAQLRASEPPRGTAAWWAWYMQSKPDAAEGFLGRKGGPLANAQRLMRSGEYQPGDSFGPINSGDPQRTKLTWKQIQKRFRNKPKVLAALRYQRGEYQA